jgi:prepilin-type N-terminal cleavage/methylation domain-containing protein
MSARRANGDKGGFTLVELLIALAIGSVVMAGAVGMFRSQRIAFELMNQMKIMEENGRVAMDVMAREFRKSGGGGVPFVPLDSTAGAAYATAQTGLGAKAGTDIVEVFSSVLREPVCLSTAAGAGLPGYNAAAANLKAYETALIGLPGWILPITSAAAGALLGEYTVLIYAPSCPLNNNCTQDITENNAGIAGDKVQIGYSRGQNLDYANRPHDCDPVVVACPSGTVPDTVCFNIGSDVYFYVNANNQLMKYVLGGTYPAGVKGEVIADYVEDFQVSYAQDANADNLIQGTEWRHTASNATLVDDPTKVRMAKISILMKSKNIDPAKTTTLAPLLENSTVAFGAADKYRRRVFARTIRLRNMEVN